MSLARMYLSTGYAFYVTETITAQYHGQGEKLHNLTLKLVRPGFGAAAELPTLSQASLRLQFATQFSERHAGQVVAGRIVSGLFQWGIEASLSEPTFVTAGSRTCRITFRDVAW
jgi:hypothetical protein